MNIINNYTSSTGKYCLALSLVFFAQFAQTEESKPLNIAVASNFAPTMERIVTLYKQQSDQPINVLSGATGKHYAQIAHGAPMHLFFAADKMRPQKLVDKGIAHNPFPYAIGQLVYWYPNYHGKSTDFATAIQLPVKRLSLANPRHAPYGQAATQTLKHAKRWALCNQSIRCVFGDNINQSDMMIRSGAVDAGFISASHAPQYRQTANQWLVPSQYHAPITQVAVTVKAHSNSEAFLQFFRSKAVQQIIADSGYLLP